MTWIKALGGAVLITLGATLAGCTVGDVLTPSWGGKSPAEENERENKESERR